MNRTAGDTPSAKPVISEARSLDQSQLEYALKIGLAPEPNKINYYRRVAADPKGYAREAILRPFGGQMLDILLDFVLRDAVAWSRFKTVMTKRKNSRGLRENISETGLKSLVEKSLEHELPLEVIFEVYSRGAQIGGEREGFGRVNSFVAGGAARKMDADLIDEEKQEEAPRSTTLTRVKRILKENRQ